MVRGWIANGAQLLDSASLQKKSAKIYHNEIIVVKRKLKNRDYYWSRKANLFLNTDIVMKTSSELKSNGILRNVVTNTF